jgi:protein-tyrosine phosphatase
MAGKTRILFVCLGNICRSPLAEGIFVRDIETLGIRDRFHVDSAGTAAWHVGERADPRSIAIGESMGCRMEMRARQIRAQDFEDFDLLLAMDRSNLRDLQAIARRYGFQTELRLMRDFDSLGTGEDVPDPYYGGLEGFREVAAMLERSCQGLLRHLGHLP